MNGLFERLAQEYSKYYSRTQQAVITPLPQYWVGSARLQLFVALGASFLLLISACVTTGNLFLSRTLACRQEIATRISLGAGISQLFAQLLAEGSIAALTAATGGVAIAWAVIKILSALAPPDIPRLADAGLNWQVLCFAATLSLLAAVACSVAPISLATRMNLETVLREGGTRTTDTRHGQRMQSVFIAAQTAITVILLTASLLVVLSVRSMLKTDLGFTHRDAVTINLALRGPQANPQGRHLFYTQLLRRLRDFPAVTSVGAVLVRPLEGSVGWDMSYESEFDESLPPNQYPVSNFEVISPGYFQTVGTPLLAGRDFNERDRENTEKVVIISNGLAERMRHGGHEPIGARIRFGRHHEGDWWKIIGITTNTRYRGVLTRDEDIYVCYLQSGIPVNYLVIRGRGTPNELTALVRRQVAALDPAQAIANVATIGQLADRDTARQRFNMVLLLGFGWTALLLAAAGVYSVIAEIVTLRTREIAIRLALGSSRPALIRRFIVGTLQFVIAGEMAGLLASLTVGRFVSGLLYAVKPDNPAVLTAVLLFVLIVSIMAAFLPAWAASGQNPRRLLQ